MICVAALILLGIGSVWIRFLRKIEDPRRRRTKHDLLKIISIFKKPAASCSDIHFSDLFSTLHGDDVTRRIYSTLSIQGQSSTRSMREVSSDTRSMM